MTRKYLFALVLACLALCFSQVGCGRTQKADPSQVHAMGSQVKVGPLTYQVINTEWRDSLETAAGAKQPKNRFLLLNITVNNTGYDDAGVPLLALIDSAGKEYMEERKGDGVPQWLGYLRVLNPGTGQSGYVLFDVPAASYKLRVSSGGDPDQEATALIDIPLQVEAAPAKEEPGLPPVPEKK